MKREKRFSLDEASAILKRDEDQHFRTNINCIQLKVSQASSVEQFDKQLASQFEKRGSNEIVQMNSTHSNDGTNARTFLPVAVADIIFMLDKGDEFFARLAESVEQTIWYCPRKLTRTAMHVARNYDAVEAYIILQSRHIFTLSYKLYEELPFADGVYSPAGRENYIPNCAVSVVTTFLLFLPLILWF